MFLLVCVHRSMVGFVRRCLPVISTEMASFLSQCIVPFLSISTQRWMMPCLNMQRSPNSMWSTPFSRFGLRPSTQLPSAMKSFRNYLQIPTFIHPASVNSPESSLSTSTQFPLKSLALAGMIKSWPFSVVSSNLIIYQ
jgi:hypothetical protein